MNTIDLLVLGLVLYAGLGVGFAVGFVAFGIGVVDPSARGAAWGFRVLIFPGVVALWPVLWWKWSMKVLRRGGRR